MLRKTVHLGFFIIIIMQMGLLPAKSYAKRYKVLVVMSYHESKPWVKEVKEGIDSEIGGLCDLKYFYMDTKRNLEKGSSQAQKAYALFQEFKPDGVIAIDDNAQSLFVVPYLKDKVSVPVIFGGVNNEPEEYGYPASNVTGILERPHIGQSIAFAQQLVPSIKTFGFIGKEGATTQSMLRQIQKEAVTYPAKFVVYKLPATMEEALVMVEDLKESCDAMLIVNMEGIRGKNGKSMKKKDVLPVLVRAFGKPTISDITKDLRYGVLCSVAVTGQEQGATSASMLLEAMQGAPVSKIPITRNMHGKVIINVTAMKALGIKPRPILLKGTDLVKTE